MRTRFWKIVLILVASALLYLIWFFYASLNEEDCQTDYALVLGYQVYADATLSPRLRARLDHAVYLHRQGRFKYFIVSGGTDPEHNLNEAYVMTSYLITKGINPAFILSDPQGQTTRTSAINSWSITNKHPGNWSEHREHQTILAISQFYHLPRTRMALRQAGFNQVCSSYARYIEWRDIYSTMRELIAWPVYTLRIK